MISILKGGLVARTRETRNVTIMDLEGEIRRRNSEAPTLHQFMTAELDKGKRNFILNLQNVKFVDSFGVGQILASYVVVRNLGGKLKLACLPKQVRLIFDVCVISPPWLAWPDEDVPYDTVEAALDSFGEP